MASILPVKGRWRALVRRKGFPTQCQTFDTESQAKRWARQVEADIDAGITPQRVDAGGVTVAEFIRTYRELRSRSRPISALSSEHYMLRRLQEHLGEHIAVRLQVDDLVGYARLRVNDDEVAPSTVNEEISKLGTVLRYASHSLRVVVPDVVKSARPVLDHLGLIGAANKRERRPQEDELTRVLTQLREKRGQVYADAVEFAAHSAMRRSEVCAALRSDVDRAKRLLLIRDRKHPRQKKGNDQWIPLLGRAWEIVQAALDRADDEPRIFPIQPGAFSKYFRWACRDEHIIDLRLHDLRHESTSALFEMGLAIPEVAMVTGHKDWKQLKRYTNLRPESLHDVVAAKQGKPQT
jgi:integrase